MRTKKEIEDAIKDIESNSYLTYGYREDVISILEWVLGGPIFDGLGEREE